MRMDTRIVRRCGLKVEGGDRIRGIRWRRELLLFNHRNIQSQTLVRTLTDIRNVGRLNDPRRSVYEEKVQTKDPSKECHQHYALEVLGFRFYAKRQSDQPRIDAAGQNKNIHMKQRRSYTRYQPRPACASSVTDVLLILSRLFLAPLPSLAIQNFQYRWLRDTKRRNIPCCASL